MKCPICKQGIRGRKLEKDLVASQIVDDLITNCTHADCQWNGPYALLKKHQRWCQLKPKKAQHELGEDVELFEVENMERETIEIEAEQPGEISITVEAMENEAIEVYCDKVLHL
jgi:ribosomal protein S10